MATLRYCLAFSLLLVGRYGFAQEPAAADAPATAEQATDDAEWMPKFVLLINELPTVAPSGKAQGSPFGTPSPGEGSLEPFASQASFAAPPERKEASDTNTVTIHVPVYETQYREVERQGNTVRVPIMVPRMVPMKVPAGVPLPVTIECDDVSIQTTTTDEGDAGYTFAIKGRLRMRLVSGATLSATNATFRDGVLSLEDARLTSADAEISFTAGTLKMDVERLRLSRPGMEAVQPVPQPAEDDPFLPL